MTEKDIDRIADRVAEKLRQVKKIDRYKETEAMLRAYPNYKRIIEKNNSRIDEILKNGLGETVKIKTGENVQGGLKKYEGVPEKEIEKIEHLKSENLKMEKRIIRVDNALMNIRNDKYYNVIALRKTVGRNRTRLIKELQFNLFPELLLD